MWDLLDQLSAKQWILILGLVLVGALWLWHRFLHFLAGRRGFSSQRRGRQSEKDAVKLLRSEGFEILEDGFKYKNLLLVNGKRVQFPISPDLLVRKDGIDYVVEVKSGEHTGISNAPVRRQVLEYLYATNLPCLLVRMSEGEIDLIELDRTQNR